MRYESDGAVIRKEDLLEIFSDIADDEERSFSDRLKAAEFLMRYGYGKDEQEGVDKVIIVDDIRNN